MRTDCIICRQNNLSKNTVGINKKLLGEDIENFYCMDCLAEGRPLPDPFFQCANYRIYTCASMNKMLYFP